MKLDDLITHLQYLRLKHGNLSVHAYEWDRDDCGSGPVSTDLIRIVEDDGAQVVLIEGNSMARDPELKSYDVNPLEQIFLRSWMDSFVDSATRPSKLETLLVMPQEGWECTSVSVGFDLAEASADKLYKFIFPPKEKP